MTPAEISQSYTLRPAIYGFARPKDKEAGAEFIVEYEKAIETYNDRVRQVEARLHQKRTLAPFGDFEAWQAENERLHQKCQAKQSERLNKLIKKFGGQIPTLGAKAYSSKNPVTHGLLEALNTGVAVLVGRAGGVVTEIPASTWSSGEWEFQTQGNFVCGGVPRLEIYDVTIWPAAVLQQKANAPDVSNGLIEPSKRGTKAKFDWEVLQAKFYRMADDDALSYSSDPNYSDYARRIAEWSAEQFGEKNTPDEETIRPKVKPWFEIYLRTVSRK